MSLERERLRAQQDRVAPVDEGKTFLDAELKQDEVFAKVLKEQANLANDAMNYHEIELERAKRIYLAATTALERLGEQVSESLPRDS